MLRTLAVYPELCTGCHQCELWCSFAKTAAINPARARIHVLRREPSLDVPLVCVQCGLCIACCSHQAIERNERTGAVVVDEKACVGCDSCIAACPYGMITKDPTARTVLKCDLCSGSPECAMHCRTGAIRYEDATLVAGQRREVYARVLGVELRGGSASNVIL